MMRRPKTAAQIRAGKRIERMDHMEEKTEKLSDRNGLDDMSGLQILWVLFKNIFVLSASTFGGGFVIIGMIRQRFVEKLHWLSEEEVLDLTVIAQSTPGPLGVNMAVITGYRIRGIWGAIVCALGACLPPMIIISVISVFYNQFKDNRIIALLLQVMRAGVASVIVDVVITLAGNIVKTKNLLWIGMMAAAFVATVWLKVDAAVLILICGGIGLVYSLVFGKRGEDV